MTEYLVEVPEEDELKWVIMSLGLGVLLACWLGGCGSQREAQGLPLSFHFLALTYSLTTTWGRISAH